MINLIFTIDYEIFGDGSGDVKKQIIWPTNQLLDIFDEYGAKLTLMFEVGEYWSFKQLDERGDSKLNYNPSELMAMQARNAIKRGHDVQLHLHPQWLGARYENGKWLLNSNWTKLSDLPGGLGSKLDSYSITGALYNGKKDLEELLQHCTHSYRCLGFRAGGWCIQPSGDIINAMRNVGIISDTSVFVGGFSQKKGIFFDFRKAPRNKSMWWTSSEDVCESSAQYGQGILEIPIYTETGSILSTISIPRLKSFVQYLLKYDLNSRNSRIEKKIGYDCQEILNVFSEYSTVVYNSFIKKRDIIIKFDFTKLPASKMINMINNIKSNSETDVTIVLIGHTKDPYSSRSIHKFLNHVLRLKEMGILQFSTYQEVIDKQISGLEVKI